MYTIVIIATMNKRDGTMHSWYWLAHHDWIGNTTQPKSSQKKSNNNNNDQKKK